MGFVLLPDDGHRQNDDPDIDDGHRTEFEHCGRPTAPSPERAENSPLTFGAARRVLSEERSSLGRGEAGVVGPGRRWLFAV
jgi:hypothetical protein